MTPEALAAVAAVTKQALAAPMPSAAAQQAQWASYNKAEMLRNAGKIILAAGGLGLGARGLNGLLQMHQQSASPAMLPVPDSVPVSVPLPHHRKKLAFVEEFKNWAKNMGTGNLATTPDGIPYQGPLITLGGLGAGYGGWKAMDSLMTGRRKAQLAAEKRRAQRDLHSALLSQFSNEKQSADNALGRDLDRLYDAMTKQALPDTTKGFGWGLGAPLAAWMSTSGNLNNRGGQLANAYTTGAGLAALASGLLAYKLTKDRSPAELVKKTIKMRNRRQFNQQPSPMMAQIGNDSGAA